MKNLHADFDRLPATRPDEAPRWAGDNRLVNPLSGNRFNRFWDNELR